MPLNVKCGEYVGRSLIVVPYYGHGWIRPDLDAPPPEPNEKIGPPPFHIRLDDLVSCAGQSMGAVGKIEELHHPFDGHWCGFFLRRTDECDFTMNLGDYLVWISKKQLQVQPAPDKGLYEWVVFEKTSPCLCGFGMVAETVDYMGEMYDRAMTTRRTLLGDQT